MKLCAKVALVATLAFAACAEQAPAPPPVNGWTQSSASYASYDDYLKDRYECIMAARTQVATSFVNATTARAAPGR